MSENKAGLSVDNPQDCLSPGRMVDSDHPAVIAYALQHTQGLRTPEEKAVALYYHVRDNFYYDPYTMDGSEAGFRASTCLAQGYGFCITKAILLAAACRAVGIPARLGFADVRNHLTSAKLREKMGTDLFAFHGYAEIYLNGAWRKATPAFNLSLCVKAGILPLEFDGESDSIYHPFDASGRKHMEYVRQRGIYHDMPLVEMLAVTREVYGDNMGGFFVRSDESLGNYQDFEREVEAG